MSAPVPVVVLDHIGYRYYKDAGGRAFLPADEFEVRLVTDIRWVSQAHGDEVVSVIGIPRDEAALKAAACFQFRYGGRDARGLAVITEGLLLPAGQLRDRLGIPGPTEREVLGYRDKVSMKEHLATRGIRVPDFAPFSTRAATQLLRRYGHIVAKPRRGEGSIGIAFLDREDDVRRFATDTGATSDDYEVEERIDAGRFHIDSVVRDGVPLAATAGRGVKDTTAYLRLESLRDVAVGPGPTLRRLLEFNTRVLACYPHLSGVTHLEVFLTDDEVCFCEIAARPGGGGIIAAFLSRTGVNLDEMTLRSQLGLPIPDPPAPATHLTGYAMIYAPPGVLLADLEPPARPWVLDTQFRYSAGDQIRRPRHWGQSAATVTVRGDTESEVQSRLDEVIKLVQAQLDAAVQGL